MRTETAGKVVGTSTHQGGVWGTRAHDWAEIQEGMCFPLFRSVLEKVGVGRGTTHLDVGCGAGRVLYLSSRMGATVFGIDASPALVAIAKGRTPQAEVHVGDMEELPYEDSSFELVTGFNSFQFAASPISGLQEARRVAVRGALVVVATWGLPHQCEAAGYLAALKPLMPPEPKGAPGPFALSTDGVLEELVAKAGLRPIHVEDVDCPWVYPDLHTALRGLSSAGPTIRAIQYSGEARVYEAFAAAIAPFRLSDGSYRLENQFRYLIARR